MNNFVKTVKDLKKYFNYSVVAAKVSLKAEVAGSYLNWIWWLLEPFCMMLVYSLIFGTFFRMGTEHFNIFLFLGLTLNNFFSTCVRNAVTIIKKNKPTVSKIYLPKYILLQTDLLVNGFKMLMCLVIVFIMLIFARVPFSWRMLWLIPILIDLYLFTFSISVFLMHFGVFVEDLTPLTNVALRFVTYFAGVFYDIRTRIPAPYSEYVLRCYPVAKLLEMARNVTIFGKDINGWYLLILFGVCTVVSYFGIQMIYKYENTYMKVL